MESLPLGMKAMLWFYLRTLLEGAAICAALVAAAAGAFLLFG